MPTKIAPSLPPVNLHRKGQFEMIPDFLKPREIMRDEIAIQEKDLLQEALNKQEKKNQEEEVSMAELLRRKREQTEKALETAKIGPSKSEVEERKARLLAQRDLLR
jgi:hypothetical protein